MGNRFTFMHCSDLHLGSRFVGVTDDDPVLGKRMRASPMESFTRIVDTALERGVDFMVVSGDLYDEANVLPSVRLNLSEQFRRFGRPVFIARGNHDSETSWSGSVPYPDNVYEFPIMPSSVRIRVRGTDVEVVGVSFSGRREERNLVALLRGRKDMFTIACVHCDVDPSGEASVYAPCSSSDLRGRDIDYWALGHIHKRSIVCESPLAVYPGCIQGRSSKETGEKGAYIVTVDSGHISMEFIPTQSILWESLDVDISGKGLQDLISEVSAKVAEGSMLSLGLSGTGELDPMVRSEREDFIRAVQTGTGCTICGLTVDSMQCADPASYLGGGDMRAKVVEVGMSMSEDRRSLVDAICANPVADRYRGFFEDMDQRDIDELLQSALRRVLSRMEVSR